MNLSKNYFMYENQRDNVSKSQFTYSHFNQIMTFEMAFSYIDYDHDLKLVNLLIYT